ncbi:MAG: alanine racemase [Clostridia bacterium]|nr:alanine racemase [Clostridia bacterium]
MQKTLSIIDLRAIKDNALKIRKILGKRFFYAVVKADAYGHGAEEVARAIENIVDGFCVAIVDEGVALRVAGISKPVLVFTPPLDKSDADKAAFYSLEVTVNSAETASVCEDNFCHIKVNTGMNRSGCNLNELSKVLDAVKAEKIVSVYSHMYAPELSAESRKQLVLFNRALKLVKERNSNIFGHLSASGGILRGGDYLIDGARAGILLYGYAPSGFYAKGFTPALKVYARRTQQTQFIGGGIGYNVADRNYGKLSVYRLGYADGFFRGVPLGEKTLCMDAFISNGGEEMKCVMSDADAYARLAGTISYEVLTSVTKRSERVYLR